MIRIINRFTIIVLILVCAVALVGFFMDIYIPYLKEALLGIAALLGVLFLFKVSLRWQALLMGIKSKGYNLTTSGFNRVSVAEGVTLFYYLSVAVVLLVFFDQMQVIALLCLIFFVEGLAHLIVQIYAKPYKVLLNNKTITSITNEMKFIKWNQIKKIESRHNDVHFIDKLGRVQKIDTELILKEDKDEFIDEVNRMAREKNIYCSINCKRGYYHKEETEG